MSERDMARLLALMERHLGQGWIEAAEWLRNLPANSVDAIEARLLAGDYAGVIKEVESAALKFAAETQQAYTTAGQRAAKWLDNQPAMKEKLIRFDASGARAVRHAERNQLELVRGMTQESRETVRSILIDGHRTGINPRQQASAIRDSIGLNPNQEQFVRNYRSSLEQSDWSKALGYELSDGRSDRTIARLRRDGGALTEKQISEMTERYRQNQITWRAELIARTESAKNVHSGLQESYQQAVDRGDIKADQLVKEWIPGPVTQHARRDHRSSMLLDQRPKFNQPFILPDGTKMMFPGDGPVEHVAHCRCTYAQTLAALDKPAATTAPSAAAPTAPAKDPKRTDSRGGIGRASA